MYYVFISLLVVSIIIIFILFNKVHNLELDKIEKYGRKYNKYVEEIEKERKKKEKEKDEITRELEEKKKTAQELTEQIQYRIDAQNEIVALKVKDFEEKEQQRVAAELALKTHELTIQYDEKLFDLNKEYTELLEIVEDYRNKRNAINEEIKRKRELEEQQDFYRINLDEDSIEDISTLNGIREKLHKRENLDKMIYDSYIAKPVLEMTRRVLTGTAPSGIYKVTNILTNEIYIGKSTDIAKRWQGHVKSACGLEGVADSVFQRALKKYGIQNFTFELLEKVPKEKLTEKEKFYISFYDTINYGYNQRLG